MLLDRTIIHPALTVEGTGDTAHPKLRIAGAGHGVQSVATVPKQILALGAPPDDDREEASIEEGGANGVHPGRAVSTNSGEERPTTVDQ